jgi:hypothetical protein
LILLINIYRSPKLVLKIRKSNPLLLKNIAKNTHYGYLTLTKKSQNNTQIKTWPKYYLYYGYAFVDPTPIYIFRGPLDMSHADHFHIKIILCNIDQIMLFYS